MTSDDQWVTSVHEAGHALAYYCFGWQFEYISIKPRDAAIAYTRQLVDLRWSQIELISRHLVRRRSLTYDRAVSLLWYFS